MDAPRAPGVLIVPLSRFGEREGPAAFFRRWEGEGAFPLNVTFALPRRKSVAGPSLSPEGRGVI